MKKKYSYVGVALVVLLFGIYVVRNGGKYFKEADLYTFEKVPDFEYINQKGKTITNKDFEGKVYVVEFFFTTCPTICPIMNQKMLAIQNEFFGNPDFGIASFSIDPDTDTPKVLKNYAESYGITHQHWHLLTGNSSDEVFDFSSQGFQLPAGLGDTDHGGFYHSGLFALVDKEGHIRSRKDEHGNWIKYYRALEDPGLPDQIQELKEDIKLLLDE